MSKLTVTIDYDQDMECPADQDCQWKLYSFNRRHGSFKHPTELGLGSLGKDGLPRVTDKALRAKLKSGLAFWLSYFEHGQCVWFLKDGPVPLGVEFQWDGVRVAGLLVWEHPENELGGKTVEERAKDAAGFLKSYTSWANGEGYCYCIEDEDGKVVDSCCGFDDADYMLGQMAPYLVGHEFEVQGDARYIESDLQRKVAEIEKTSQITA